MPFFCLSYFNRQWFHSFHSYSNIRYNIVTMFCRISGNFLWIRTIGVELHAYVFLKIICFLTNDVWICHQFTKNGMRENKWQNLNLWLNCFNKSIPAEERIPLITLQKEQSSLLKYFWNPHPRAGSFDWW